MGGSSVKNETCVTDSGPIIHLSEVNSLSLLNIFKNIIIPKVVYTEVEIGGIPAELKEINYKKAEADVQRPVELDIGEEAAIKIARERDSILLTDDMEARDEAKDRGIKVHGSVGVIALGYTTGQISLEEAKKRMRKLQEESNLFVTDAIIEQGINKLEKLG